MNKGQIAAVDKHRKQIIDCIEANIGNALLDFCKDGGGPTEMDIFSGRNIQSIAAQQTPYAQAIELLRQLKQHENGFRALINALAHYGRGQLARTVQEESSAPADHAQAETGLGTQSSAGFAALINIVISDGSNYSVEDERIINHMKSPEHWSTILERLDVESIAAKLTKINEDVRAQIRTGQLTHHQKVDRLVDQLKYRIGTGAAIEFVKVLSKEQSFLYRSIFCT